MKFEFLMTLNSVLRHGSFANAADDVGLTASAAPEASRLGLDAGMDRVLLKPLPILVLAQTLHDLAEDLN